MTDNFSDFEFRRQTSVRIKILIGYLKAPLCSSIAYSLQVALSIIWLDDDELNINYYSDEVFCFFVASPF